MGGAVCKKGELESGAVSQNVLAEAQRRASHRSQRNVKGSSWRIWDSGFPYFGWRSLKEGSWRWSGEGRQQQRRTPAARGWWGASVRKSSRTMGALWRQQSGRLPEGFPQGCLLRERVPRARRAVRGGTVEAGLNNPSEKASLTAGDSAVWVGWPRWRQRWL